VGTRAERHLGAYRRLLAVYPWRFRRRFGEEMVQVFRDRLLEERRSGRRGGVGRLWVRTLLDVARSAPTERVRAVLDVEWRGLLPTGPRSGLVGYAARRLVLSLPVLLGASLVVFVVIRTTVDPLGACSLNPRVRAEDCLRLRHYLGLDRSLALQYWVWLTHFLRGDWGRSLISNRPVFRDIESALANTMVLGLLATGLSLTVGIGIGMFSSLRRYSAFDHMATGGAFVGLSIPSFWLALLLQLVVGVELTRWLHLSSPIFATAGIATPGSQGFHLLDRVRHLALPIVVLSVQEIAIYSRYVRASMLEALSADYLQTARAKGLGERRILLRHALRNALIPLTTVTGLSIGALAGGLIITETVFQYPGMGTLFVHAMRLGDYLVVLPWLMVATTFIVVLNLAADIAYAFLDPRVRFA
jgi:peptide/nickel transport system permease protein